MARMQEKRKERRLRVAIPIKLVYRGQEIAAHTGNISRLGAYVELDREVPVGSELSVRLELPAYTKNASLTGEVSCTASVFRSHFLRQEGALRWHGIGIFFTDFAQPQDHERLSRYVEHLIALEEKEISRGLKVWRKKRKEVQKKHQEKEEAKGRPTPQPQVTELLNTILARLDEVLGILRSGQGRD